MNAKPDMEDARDVARAYYRGSGRSLSVDAAAITAYGGVVVHTADMVLLARMVDSSGSPQAWADLRKVYAAPDAWYVHLLVGDPMAALRLCRREAQAKYLVFQRGLRGLGAHKIPLGRFAERMKARALRRWVDRPSP